MLLWSVFERQEKRNFDSCLSIGAKAPRRMRWLVEEWTEYELRTVVNVNPDTVENSIHGAPPPSLRAPIVTCALPNSWVLPRSPSAKSAVAMYASRTSQFTGPFCDFLRAEIHWLIN